MISIVSSDFFNDDIKIIYFEVGNKSHLPEKALGIIIQARTKYRSVTCSDYPIRCSNGATFLINTKKLNHPQDFKAVDHGVFINNRTQHRYFSVERDFSGELEIKRLPTRPSVKKRGLYDLKTTYWVNQLHRDFKRRSYQVNVLSSADSKPLDCILVQYLFDGEEHAISQAPHG